MFGRKPQRFWNWFVENSTRLHGHDYANDQSAIHEISKQLRKHTHVSAFQVSALEDGIRTLELSADGLKAQIPHVEALAALAPPLPGWKIVAFRQPCSEPIELKMGDIVLSAATILGQLHGSGPVPNLALKVPGLDERNHVHLMGAVFILLDSLIGEYRVMTQLGEIQPIPGELPNPFPISELSGRLDAFF